MATIACTIVRASDTKPEGFNKLQTIILVCKTPHSLDEYRATTNAAVVRMYNEIRSEARFEGRFQRQLQALLPAVGRAYTMATRDASGHTKVPAVDEVMAKYERAWKAAGNKGLQAYQMMLPLRPADSVMLLDLTSSVDLNGAHAVVIRHDSDRARYHIRLDSGREIWARGANLRAARARKAFYLSVECLTAGPHGGAGAA